MISVARPQPHSGVTRAIGRHSFKIIAALALGIVGALAYTAIAPVYYGSEAKIFVRIGRESVSLDPTATTGQTVSVQDSRENELNSILEVLTSRAILEGVVDDLGPSVILGRDGKRDPIAEVDLADASHNPTQAAPTIMQKLNPLTDYSRRDDAIQRLSKRLTVTNPKKSDVITIFCEGQSPDITRQIVEKVIELARDAHTRVNRIAGSQDFFAEQTNAERTQLNSLETKLRDLKDRSGIASLQQQRELHLKQIGELQQELLRTDRTLQAAGVQNTALQNRLSKQPATVITSETTGMPVTAASAMRGQFYTLQIREQELASRLTDLNPQLVQLRAQLAQAEATLRDEKTFPQIIKGENKTYKDLEMATYTGEAGLQSLRTQQQALTSQLADARESLKSMNDVERQFAGLDRDLDVSRLKYRRYAENLEQARIDQALASQRISNINILQQPTVSYTPIRPRAMFNLSIGLGLGLVLAAAIVALSEQRRRDRMNAQAENYSTHGSQGMEDSHGNGAGRFHGDFQTTGSNADTSARRIVYHAK